MKTSNQVSKPGRVTFRARIAIAFRKIAGAVDARMAHRKTKDFYRSGGAVWTSGLN